MTLALVILLTGALIQYFYNRGWYPQDAGVFAHAADRLISSDKGVAQIDDVHPGYLNFVNAWALSAFGPDFVSMNYPLMAIVFLQSLLVFFTFWKRGAVLALTAALVPAALGVFQFNNPNHHWYALFLSLTLACLLSRPPVEGSGRRFMAGFLVASIFLFRQLTGMFMALACVAFFLYEARTVEQLGKERQKFARPLFWLMLLGIVFYLLRATNLTGFLLFGLAPLTVLWWSRFNVQVREKEIRRILFQYLSGIALGFMPMLLYHIIQGDMGPWLLNTFVASLSILNQAFLSGEDYFKIVFCGAYQLMAPKNPVVFLNGIFWFLVPLAGVVNLIMLMRRLQAVPSVPAHKLAFPFLGLFFGLVALHYQIPSYLFFTISFPVLGVLWMSGANPGLKRSAVTGTILALMAIGLYFHAGQPLDRKYLEGERAVTAYAGDRIPRLHLWVSAADLAVYAETMDLVRANSQAGESIFVVPNDAEIYFLTQRRNPFRFLSTDQGIHDASSLAAVLASLMKDPPQLIIDRPLDKRHTEFSKQMMAYVSAHYELLRNVGPFDIYIARRP